MEIRTATQDDIPAMAELLHQLFSIEADFTPDYPAQVKGLELLMERPTAWIFVAEVDKEVVGMCTVQIIVSTAMGQAVGAIEDVVVDVGHRDRGIGAALMHAVEQWAIGKGLGRLQLQADQDNGPALGFYRRQGWRRTNLTGWMKPL